MASTSSPIGSSPSRSSATLEVHLLGVVDFDAALFLQERLAFEISGRKDVQGALLLCEHPPMVTIGREGSRTHLLCESGDFVARQMEIRWLNRGGGCLVHAPGQLAVYPILPLNRLRLGLADYRNRLEQAVIDMCAEQKVPAHRLDNEPGATCRCGQFAFIGAAVKSWVSYHGMFVNVNPSMELMRMVQPNPSGEKTTSLAAQRHKVVSMHSVREGLVRHLASQLGYERYHLYTGHPLLKRTKKKVYVHA